ncbi:MAG: CHAT domain-containing protein, partial [Victivallales bacterium]|nr:CHAT domain-containing protein [Victivallales bacterium]
GMKWHYADMMGFNVKNVDSIALSACSTAISEKSTGGEIEGMAYQLLRKSPSGSVLASFWPVDDEATAELMTTYYTHIVNSIKANRTLDRGGALRKAQLKLLANPQTSSPHHWAAFTLFGDYR